MLLDEFKDIARSVSSTTRPPRGNEQDGREYRFLSDKDFRARLSRGEFLEHAEVHGHIYGTPRGPIEEHLAAGRDVLLTIDVQGADQVRRTVSSAPAGDPIKSAYVDVFIIPPSMEILRKRLAARNEDSPETIALRLKNAEKEMGCRPLYMHEVVNDDLACAYGKLRAIVLAERQKSRD